MYTDNNTYYFYARAVVVTFSGVYRNLRWGNVVRHLYTTRVLSPRWTSHRYSELGIRFITATSLYAR